MLDALDAQDRLTTNQWKLVVAATFGIILEFLDYFLIGFVLAFVIGPWHLSLWQSSTILLSSGVGAMIGAALFGWLADKIGRRKVFLMTISLFTTGTAALIVTPDSAEYGWLYLTAFRFFVGFGAGGLYCVDLPLVQEFVPSRKRGLISGLVTSAVPVGFLLGSALVAFLAPSIGWRGLMAICVGLGLVTLLMRSWIPESPRWLLQNDRREEARKAVAWALNVPAQTLSLDSRQVVEAPPKIADLFRYPRSIAVSWLTNLGAQTGYYGLTLWSPVLIVQFLKVRPEQAAFYMIFVTLAAFAGRITISFLSESIGRRASGMLCSFGAVACLLVAAWFGNALLGATVLLLALLMASYFFGEGGFAIVGPYSAELWPTHLRTMGMGSAYGFGGIGKFVGPMGLAVIAGVSAAPNTAGVSVQTAFLYFAIWYALSGLAYMLLGIETKGQSIEAIARRLDEGRRSTDVRVGQRPSPEFEPMRHE
jgi:putative MFS transporter